LALEKLRKLLAEIIDQPFFSVALAQAVLRQSYDSVDIVTRVTNRADQSLEAARSAPDKVATVAAAVA
jgi:hypothetical protein